MSQTKDANYDNHVASASKLLDQLSAVGKGYAYYEAVILLSDVSLQKDIKKEEIEQLRTIVNNAKYHLRFCSMH
jgi:hypothetical protein